MVGEFDDINQSHPDNTLVDVCDIPPASGIELTESLNAAIASI